MEDPEHKKFHVPGSELSPGQFLLQPKTSESFPLKYDGQTIRLKRRQAGSCCFRLLFFAVLIFVLIEVMLLSIC